MSGRERERAEVAHRLPAHHISLATHDRTSQRQSRLHVSISLSLAPRPTEKRQSFDKLPGWLLCGRRQEKHRAYRGSHTSIRAYLFCMHPASVCRHSPGARIISIKRSRLAGGWRRGSIDVRRLKLKTCTEQLGRLSLDQNQMAPKMKSDTESAAGFSQRGSSLGPAQRQHLDKTTTTASLLDASRSPSISLQHI
ncbi:hypothetical protein VTN02DRAFT_3072 [Thermoascus thermophilus]